MSRAVYSHLCFFDYFFPYFSVFVRYKVPLSHNPPMDERLMLCVHFFSVVVVDLFALLHKWHQCDYYERVRSICGRDNRIQNARRRNCCCHTRPLLISFTCVSVCVRVERNEKNGNFLHLEIAAGLRWLHSRAHTTWYRMLHALNCINRFRKYATQLEAECHRRSINAMNCWRIFFPLKMIARKRGRTTHTDATIRDKINMCESGRRHVDHNSVNWIICLECQYVFIYSSNSIQCIRIHWQSEVCYVCGAIRSLSVSSSTPRSERFLDENENNASAVRCDEDMNSQCINERWASSWKYQIVAWLCSRRVVHVKLVMYDVRV